MDDKLKKMFGGTFDVGRRELADLREVWELENKATAQAHMRRWITAPPGSVRLPRLPGISRFYRAPRRRPD